MKHPYSLLSFDIGQFMSDPGMTSFIFYASVLDLPFVKHPAGVKECTTCHTSTLSLPPGPHCRTRKGHTVKHLPCFLYFHNSIDSRGFQGCFCGCSDTSTFLHHHWLRWCWEGVYIPHCLLKIVYIGEGKV